MPILFNSVPAQIWADKVATCNLPVFARSVSTGRGKSRALMKEV